MSLFFFSQTCHFDPLLDDSVQLCKRMRQLGKTADLTVLEDLPHGFLNFALISKEARQGSNVCVSKLRKLLQVSWIFERLYLFLLNSFLFTNSSPEMWLTYHLYHLGLRQVFVFFPLLSFSKAQRTVGQMIVRVSFYHVLIRSYDSPYWRVLVIAGIFNIIRQVDR